MSKTIVLSSDFNTLFVLEGSFSQEFSLQDPQGVIIGLLAGQLQVTAGVTDFDNTARFRYAHTLNLGNGMWTLLFDAVNQRLSILGMANTNPFPPITQRALSSPQATQVSTKVMSVGTTDTDGTRLVGTTDTEGTLVGTTDTDGTRNVGTTDTDGTLVGTTDTEGTLVGTTDTEGTLVGTTDTDGTLVGTTDTDGTRNVGTTDTEGTRAISDPQVTQVATLMVNVGTTDTDGTKPVGAIEWYYLDLRTHNLRLRRQDQSLIIETMPR